MRDAYREAVAFAVSRLRNLVKGRHLRALEIHPSEVFYTFYFDIRNGSDQKGVFVLCRDEALTWLTMRAESERGIYDLVCKLIASRIIRNEPLPEQSRSFAGLHIAGMMAAPAKQAKRSKNFTDNLMLYWTAKLIEDQYPLRLTRNDAGAATSACDAVADALAISGHKKSYRAIKELCHAESAKAMRVFAHQLSDSLMAAGAQNPEMYAYWQSQAPWNVVTE